MSYLKSGPRVRCVGGQPREDSTAICLFKGLQSTLLCSQAEIICVLTALMSKRKATQGHLVAMGNRRNVPEEAKNFQTTSCLGAFGSFIELYFLH